jgi:regulator of RNase E activity RraA
MTGLSRDETIIDLIRTKACSGMFSDFTNGDGKSRVWSDFKVTGNKNILGVVRTVELEATVTSDENLAVGLPFLTSLNKGDVLVVKGSGEFAYFGELMANLAIRTGVDGTIVFGASRDTRAISKLNYSLHATSFTPVDIKGRGRVKAVDRSFKVDEYEIVPQSWVFADSDGAVFFPFEIAETVLNEVLKMIHNEQAILGQIADGLSGADLANIHKGF